MTDSDTHQMAIDLALDDIRHAAKDFFDLHPGLREFTVVISDDGVVTVQNIEGDRV